MAYEIHMRKDDIAACAAVEGAAGAPPEGAVRVKIDRAALTANNVTYAALGEQFAYWRFFPAPDGFGIVPIWGFADVVESRADGVAEGARVWGYFPFASHATLHPSRVNERGFDDGAPHRASLAKVYNRYEFARPADARAEALDAVFRPLFTTSFLIDAHYAAARENGAARVAFASASSKTALGAAFLTRRRGVETVALTSAKNAAFCARTGAYDRIVTYDALEALPADGPVALVDMAGDAGLIDRLADRLGDAFVHNTMVGATHVGEGRRDTKGPPRSLFFAPSVIEEMNAAWGPAGFAERYASAWAAFAATLDWLDLAEARGADAMMDAWRRQLAGAVPPEEGIILRP